MPIVLAPDANAADLESARALARRVETRCGVALEVESHRRDTGLGPAVHLGRDVADLGPEDYALRVRPDAVRVRAGGSAGLRWATETLLQWMRADGRLPAVEIDDGPDFPRRGVMLDISRGKVPTLEDLCALVERCAAWKLNVLMLYIEHPFAFRRHPEIGAGCSPLRADELRTLDAYAALRHVELVPNLQTLGHMERVLVQARYAPLAEGDARWTLAPAHPGSYALLGELFDELLPNFRSPLTHINCDEPWDLGTGQSKALADALGGPAPLLVRHVETLRALLAEAHGRGEVMMWADFAHGHPEQIDAFDPSMIFCDWWYEGDFDADRVARFAAAGRRFWVCGGTCAWNALFPRVGPALDTISRWADAGRRHGAEGLLVTEWGDFGHYNLLGNTWLALAWAAQEAWSGPVDEASFDRAFGAQVFDDATRRAARVYRELGACHDVGYALSNASPVAFLFFDDLADAVFARGAKRGAVERTRRRAQRVADALARDAEHYTADRTTYDELVWAADATLFALDKTLAALPYLAWREGATRSARERRALARRLRALADTQRAPATRHRALWRRRAAVSNYDVNASRMRRSITSLRRAAGELERDRAVPLPEHPGYAPRTVLRLLREATGWPPGPRS